MGFVNVALWYWNSFLLFRNLKQIKVQEQKRLDAVTAAVDYPGPGENLSAGIRYEFHLLSFEGKRCYSCSVYIRLNKIYVQEQESNKLHTVKHENNLLNYTSILRTY